MNHALRLVNRLILYPEVLYGLLQKRSTVGGQAVIEGVMMKSRRSWAVAVRGVDGGIHTLQEELKPTPALFRLPLLRGPFVLIQSIILGVKAIDFSASKAYDEEDKKMSPLLSLMAIIVAFVLGAALFILLPLFITRLLGTVFAVVKDSAFVFNLIDGLVRVVIFVLYIILIGLWDEMKRIYEYHGAEHKVIHAYEDGSELVPETIGRVYSPQHPRCGTSFLLIVMIISILIFSLIPHDMGFVGKLVSRLLLIPLVAGVSYEMLKLSSRGQKRALFRLLSLPGLALQRLTTREPDMAQIEVAIVSLRAALEAGDV